MAIASVFREPDWVIESCERRRLLRCRETVAYMNFVTPYFSTEGGNFAYGMIGMYDGQWRGLRPSTHYNSRLMSAFLAWQQDCFCQLQKMPSSSGDEWANCMMQQIFICDTLWRFGPNLVECKAGTEKTALLEAGLRQIRRSLECGAPASEEFSNLVALLEVVDCIPPQVEAA